MTTQYRTITVRIPDKVVEAVDFYVDSGIESSRNAAVGMLVRIGLRTLEDKKHDMARAAKVLDEAKAEALENLV